MHISVEQFALMKTLTLCSKVVDKKSVLPILTHVLLRTDDNILSITATDMDMELITSMPAQVMQQGSACVPATLLRDIIKNLPSKSVVDLKLSDDMSRLIITCNRSRFEVGSLPPEDFPEISSTQLSHSFTIPAGNLKSMLKRTHQFVSAEENRINLSGVYLHSYNDVASGTMMLRAVASDMRRLSCVQCSAPAGAQNFPPALVAVKTCEEILELITDSNDVVDLSFSSVRIECKTSSEQFSARLTSRLVDGVFPEYDEALIVPDDKKMIVRRVEFLEAVERVGSVVSTDKIKAVHIHVTQTQATLSTLSKEFGSATEDLDIEFSSTTPVDVYCNVEYIKDVTKMIETDEIELLLQDQDSSILIKPVNKNDMQFILMPIEIEHSE